MKPVFLLFWLAATVSASAQNLSKFRFHPTATTACNNEIYGLTGSLDSLGRVLSLTGTGFSQGNYINLLRHGVNNTLQAGHSQVFGSPVPHSVFRRGNFIYAAVVMLQGEIAVYYLLKYDDSHTLLAVKKVGQIITDVIQSASVQLFPIPGSPEMLVCYHTVTPGDLVSEIHLYSVNSNLEPTASIHWKIAFTGAHNQTTPFNSSGNCHFFLADSVLHYSLLMNNFYLRRLETGKIKLGTDSVFCRWSSPVTGTSISQPNYIAEVRNDSVYHLVNSALALYTDSDTTATYYRFDTPTMACRGLTRTRSGDWVGIFTDYLTLNALCKFRPGSPDITFHNYDNFSPMLIHTKDDSLVIWGKVDNCALGLDKFAFVDMAYCHTQQGIRSLLTASVTVRPSSVTLSATTAGFAEVPLYTPKNLYNTVNLLCGYLGMAEAPAGGVQLYPNPTDGLLNLSSENGPISDLVLKTLTGQTIGQKHPAEDRLTWDLSDLPAGVYVMEIQTAAGFRTEKIVKR